MNTLNREINPHITPVDEDVLRPRFALGLQGGGSWGAWTAGVIKVLIPALCARGTITAVSGTSAGAMNGAALVAGLNTDGPYDGVRRVEELWNNVKGYGQLFGIHPSLTQIFADSSSPWPNLPKPISIWPPLLEPSPCSSYRRDNTYFVEYLAQGCAGYFCRTKR